MDIQTITPEEIQKLINHRNKGRLATKAWKEKHPDYNKNYSREYNKPYFDAMKQQKVFCDCCQVEVKKISYSNHVKGKRHIAKASVVASVPPTWVETGDVSL